MTETEQKPSKLSGNSERHTENSNNSLTPFMETEE